MIEVFVRSFSTYMDVETCRDMVQHPFCAPNTTEGLISKALDKLKDRVLSQEDSNVLDRVLQIANETGESVKIYDVSQIADSFRARKHGIRKTPTVRVNGEKYEGLEQALRMLSAKR